MDSGAHFHRCDFQVHSPRDRQWDGDRPVTTEERRDYANRFVAACRERQLDAVAITDHHDLAFFPIIKEAAEDQLIVFPGMELTLGVPCQSLLILDADFPPSLLPQVPLALGLEPAPDADARHAETQPILDCRDLDKVVELLDRHEFLRGRYILIPNVTENGHGTLLRQGFRDHYANMPCVAGYVDGSVPQPTAYGWWSITEGRDQNYGSKRIGVFQTSDSRDADFRTLGSPSTWVKWAEPTAEALRQACLARDTRISLNQPELPPILIRRLHVSNSRFLGPVDIEFNPQCNCLIGGRGTGKSTVLEYLRWALCDQPPDSANEEDLPDFQLKRAELIENTLSPFEAVVTVEFELNGVPHVVRRKAEPPQISLKIADYEFRECDEQEIRDLLPVQAYSQKQLSSVGVRTDELLRLLRSPVKSELADLDRREGQLLDRLRSAAEARHAKRRAERDIRREETQRRSLASQLAKLREVLKGVTPEDQGTLNAHAGYEGERAYVRTSDDRLARLQETVNLLVTEISLLGPPAPNGDDAETPNAELMAKLADAYAQIHTGAAQRAQALQRFLSEEEEVEEYKSRRDEWGDKSAQHAVSYEQAKGRASSQQSIIDAIADVEEKVQRLNNSISERKSEIERMGDPEAGFSELLAAWAGLASEHAALLSGECDRLTALSDERIRATLVRGQDTGEIQRRLGALITGTRIRQAKIEKLCQHVSAADDPLSEWWAIAEELAGLVDIAGAELSETDLPETPLLNRLGFTAAELLRIASKITVQDWINVALAEIGDEPEFQYRQSEGEFIRFANASAGQQATALLQVLLKQSGPPLIIDQPEEDLDNEVVLDIVASIWAAKSKRQLLLSSHNANIVVNGDADLVVVCAYRNAGDHTAGTIANAGAIDVKRVRDAITSIMEGGERAFRLRQEKYGF